MFLLFAKFPILIPLSKNGLSPRVKAQLSRAAFFLLFDGFTGGRLKRRKANFVELLDGSAHEMSKREPALF